jgi:hypothetical protein
MGPSVGALDYARCGWSVERRIHESSRGWPFTIYYVVYSAFEQQRVVREDTYSDSPIVYSPSIRNDLQRVRDRLKSFEDSRDGAKEDWI